MLNDFQKYLSELIGNEQSFEKTQYSFLLAVSGGLDSVVMTELFRLSGYQYGIAHCNFQLRGKESGGDEDFVKELAAKANVPFYSVRFETEKFCTENNLSVQMGARQLRYDWLEETRQKSKSDYLVTAHHADDAIETFFINLLRGTGISGLHGIKAKNENIIRPLLHFYRKEIEFFAQKNKLKWREDSSNATDKYERNKIRHNLLPALEDINPMAKQAITETIGNIERTETILNNSIHKITREFVTTEGDCTFIHFNFFKQLTPTATYLYETIKRMGFNYEQCKQISENIRGQPGKIFLSATHRVVIDRENLIIEPIKIGVGNSSFEIEKERTEFSTETYKYLFETFERTADFKIPREPEKAALDFDKLTFPLKIRKWQAGDRFYPLGMNKPKKVSDFLIDTKVSLSEKDHVYVLVSGEDIAWVIAYRPDERFKLTKGTKNVYLCKSEKKTSMSKIQKPLLVDKEIIGSLHFPNDEILSSSDQKQKRQYELERAASLGTDKVKIKILFEDSDGLKQVETTVWAVTKDRIVLKHGITIPIKRIHEIKI